MKKDKNKELEMKNSSTQSNELNDDDLDNVAGGCRAAPYDLSKLKLNFGDTGDTGKPKTLGQLLQQGAKHLNDAMNTRMIVGGEGK